MELQQNRESVCIHESVFDGALEQPLELDYLLPDYCPGIFKVLECRVSPKITSARTQGEKILIDGTACIKILYVAEESYRICSITQKLPFSKSAELRENAEDAVIHTAAHCSYAHCRAVNPRRLDVRGAVSIQTNVTAAKTIEVLSGASGMGVQIDSKEIIALDRRLCAEKTFSIRESLELAYGKPAVHEILDESAEIRVIEQKVLANKILLKGELALHMLYACEDPQAGPEIMDYAIPFSQIIDLSGVTEEYHCQLRFEVSSIALSVHGDAGEARTIEAECSVRACCIADKNVSTRLVRDAYSTAYALHAETAEIRVQQLVGAMEERRSCSETIHIPQGEIRHVYDISCRFRQESIRFEEGVLRVGGALELTALALDGDGIPVLLEKSSPCEWQFPISSESDDLLFSPDIQITGTTYTLLSDEELEVKAEVKIGGSLYARCRYSVIQSMEAEESHPLAKTDRASLYLYFAERGERVWEIAKRYRAPFDAVCTQNHLEEETLSEKAMLFIPMGSGKTW